MSRRQLQREATIDEIKATARAQMAEVGPAGLSLRAIARTMDFTPTALYRYYASFDDLLTDLIVDAFNALADALEAADRACDPDSHIERLRAVLHAYRAWALSHPHEFELIYGTPIPNYDAPSDRTVPAVQRGFVVLVGIIAEGMSAGTIQPNASLQAMPETVQVHLSEMIANFEFPVTPLPLYAGLICWTRIHGMIMLELFNHLAPSVGDADAYYHVEVERLIDSLTP